MAQFFKAKKQSSSRHQRNAKQEVLEKIDIAVDVIDHQGNGICLSHKPIVVIPAAIPGEQYRVQILSKKQKVWHAKILKVLQAHETARVKPFCPYVSDCGGCSHQAFLADYLIESKQASLEKYLSKVISPARLKNSVWEDVVKSDINDKRGESRNSSNSPEQGQAKESGLYAYRRRARIAIDARNSSDIKVGFRQEKSNKVVDIPACAVLSTPLQVVYEKLVRLIKALPSASSIGHITLTQGSEKAQVCLHLVKGLDTESVAMLIAAQNEHGSQYMVETKGGKLRNVLALDTDSQNHDLASASNFTISDDPSLKLSVTANNFIQVNQHLNQKMLELAQAWLAPSENDVVVDLFSGIGNFSLYLAAHCKEVIGVEGVAEMVQQANANAQLNSIENCRFEHYDLNNLSSLPSLMIPKDALIIVDPSRVGALEIMKVMSTLKPRKILYVSCNPTSFARDVDVLPSNYGIVKMRALDMFPFTKHIEMIALISSQ
ncbi:23S rRNA (uracil(1939)-C(5))-methyltransferase RlmD [Glaciecola sp. MF2-115]|uniref:23S rRNA (uracil(1939)-C(5))-methyltransferase RlmD n=1 Tax=Glaciecola sp. MF2-115 TaxID=3384827 RepID=UPI0039A2A128